MCKILPLSFLCASLCFSGCKDDRCSYTPYVGGEVLPDDCYDCQWYAPESATLSDTEYNTVTAVRNRYLCHRETLKEHIGDTLKLAGWIYCGGASTGEWMPDYTMGHVSSWLYLTDREDHLGGHQTFSIQLNSELKERFHEQYDELLEKKLYVTGILMTNDRHTGGCCSLDPVLYAFEFDTVNTG